MRYHMRRADKEFSDKRQLAKVLKGTEYMTLAMARGGEPYLVSLSHGYDEERNCLYFHCVSEGKKLDIMRECPDVWGQVIMDHGYAENECTHHYVTVMFKGRIEFIEDIEEKRQALRTLLYQLEPNPEAREKRLGTDGLPSTVFGRVVIEYMTGKKTPEIDL
ncbi:pyridoxamine 5'-phosphate oxidase family protein [Candidatus Bathyarchaeota archaeon]|nr:pyridoxamine 5'-phosphate oxidase family protein [Candidatus Bathyarchaeota archaeon]